MNTEDQTIQSDINSIVAKYAGRNLTMRKASKREQYQSEWQTSPMAKPKGEEIDPVAFTYEIMRLALHFTVTQKLKAKNKTFFINKENTKRLTKIIKCITGDIEPYICQITLNEDGIQLLVQGYNPNKGIFLYGPASTGKTFIMQSICHTLSNAYYTRWYRLDSPAYFYNYKDITMKARELKSIDFLRTFFDNKPIIFLDDLGYNKENMLNLYGNKEDIVPHLIEILYRKYTDHGYEIYITSNLSQEYIYDTFGAVTHDRIMDMCTPVSWMGDNFRVQA